MKDFARGLAGYAILCAGTIGMLAAIVMGIALVVILGTALASVFAR